MLKYFCLFLIILFPFVVKGNDTVLQINRSKDLHDLSKCIYFYEDINHNLDFNYLSKRDELFKLNKLNSLNFGYTQSAFWIKVSIKNNDKQVNDFIINIENPDINELDFYLVNNSQVIKHVSTGEGRIFSKREIKDRNFAFRLHLQPHEIYVCYFRTYNNGDSNYIPIHLYSSIETYLEYQKKIDIFFWLFIGMCFFIIILNIYLLITLKNSLYFYYVVYVVFFLLFVFNIHGFSQMYFWPNNPWWIIHSTILYLFIGLFFLIVFIEKYFNFKLSSSLMKLFFDIIKYSIITCVPLIFLDYPVLLILTIILSFFVPLIYIIAITESILQLKRKNYSAYYILAAFSVTVISVIAYLIEDAGLFENYFTKNALIISISVEMIILAIAVIDRFRKDQKDSQQLLQLQKEDISIKNKELKKLSDVASHTKNIVMILDEKEHIDWLNAEYEEIFHMQPASDCSLINMFEPNTYNLVKKYFDDCINKKTNIAFEILLPDKNKNILKWFHITFTPEINLDGKVEKIISIGSDISKLKKTEEELIKAKEKAIEADSLKTSFLANMSHEIRTPLNVINGFTELLLDEDLSSEQKNEYTLYIKNSIKDLTNLINDIIDISKIETKQIEIIHAECAINKLLDELYIIYNQALNLKKDKKIKLFLNKDIIDEDFCILTDGNRLKQIFTNLIDNAIKFTVVGSIEFGYKILNDAEHFQNPIIEFFVKDSGKGIDEKYHQLIFERFRKIENHKIKFNNGTGLGLAISKNLIELLGGIIRVESEPSEGSIFYFNIPFVEVSNSIRFSEENLNFAKKNNWKNKLILIAEDELLNFKFLQEIFKKFGAEILRSTNGIETVELCKKHPEISLILMDIRMPELDGFEATRMIRTFRPELPIIAQTAYAMSNKKEECLNAGCNEFISKPTEIKTLLDILNKYLSK